MPTTSSHSIRLPLLAAALVVLIAGAADAQNTSPRPKLDRLARARSQQVTGRSRVILTYQASADSQAITGVGGVPGRTLAGGRLQLADVDNAKLQALAADSRVAGIALDRETFSTVERTGAAVAATVARADYGVTGRGVGVAVIDSGISHINRDLLYDAKGRYDPAVVHFRDFTSDLG